jgi:hypothetical protein
MFPGMVRITPMTSLKIGNRETVPADPLPLAPYIPSTDDEKVIIGSMLLAIRSLSPNIHENRKSNLY